jgi:hypothetical protein
MLANGIKKLMNKAHIVLMVHDMQTYHEWFSLFPGLETRCDVMFMDDLSCEITKDQNEEGAKDCHPATETEAKGYHTLTRNF